MSSWFLRAALLAALALTAMPGLAHAQDSGAGGLGIDPTQPYQTGGDSYEEADKDESDEGFRFGFHGFLRVPMRVGHGGTDSTFSEDNDDGLKLHSPPQIPDAAYTDWRYTNNLTGPWTEMVLSYGNQRVSANVVIASYNITDAGYKDTLAQLGINESFLTLRAPTAFGARGGLVWNVGAFSNRYGTAGRYDAGKYDTYLFGATHAAGETLTASYKLTDSLTMVVEHGIGAKLDVTPFIDFGDFGSEVLGEQLGRVLPYGGDVQQGSTLLHHAHVGVAWKSLTAAAHYLTSWTSDARLDGEIDGRISVFGGEVKSIGTRFGDGYLGYSRVRSRNPLRVAGAIEVLHSFEGWSLRENFFGPSESATGNGDIDTILFQYTFSLATFLWHPQEFYGQDADLAFSVFGMFNRVTGADGTFPDDKMRLKAGADVTYWTPLPWLGAALRYDLVEPDLDNSDQSFHVISPKLILRTEFASHEEVYIQYSRYINGDDVAPGYPHEVLRPDDGVFAVTATMWW
jgi:hypothetical protein